VLSAHNNCARLELRLVLVAATGGGIYLKQNGNCSTLMMMMVVVVIMHAHIHVYDEHNHWHGLKNIYNTIACDFGVFHKQKKLTSVSNLNSPSSVFIRNVGFTERWLVWNSSPHKICGHE